MNFFKKDITLQSAGTKDEVIERLQQVTAGNGTRTGAETKFQGTINPIEGSFRLKQTFDYGPNNQLRPEVIGQIAGDAYSDGCSVSMHFRLPANLKWVLIGVLIFNIAFYIFLLYNNIMPEARDFILVTQPIMLVFLFVMTSYFFHLKTRVCVEVLKSTVRTKQIITG